MMDLAQAIANPTPVYPLLLDSQPLTLLPLSGAGPFPTVHVKIGNTGDIEFFLTDSTVTFADGIIWTAPKGTTSQAITFNFHNTPITGLTTTVTTGLTFGAASNGQQTGTVTVPTVATSYTFNVNTTTTPSKDPQIVVTPQ